MNTKNKESESYRIRREWAKISIRNFRFHFPEFLPRLYEFEGRFLIHIEVEQSRFVDISKVFDKSIRPMTCPAILVREVDIRAIPLNEDLPYNDELWLSGEPMPATAINKVFALANPECPLGGIDFNHDIDAWIFKSSYSLLEDEKEIVIKGMRKLGLQGEIDFQVNAPISLHSQKNEVSKNHINRNSLRLSKSLRAHSKAAQQLIAQDEDVWRSFLGQRINVHPEKQRSEKPALDNLFKVQQFSCLFDMADCSDVRLSELLTIYDRVDLIPDRNSPDWLSRHGLSVDDLMQLVTLGRCRVILPYGAEECRADILDGLASINTNSPVLSRELAARTFLQGQAKDPLLFGPFSAKQKSIVLNAIQSISSNDALRAITASYGQMFINQNYEFMLNGAMASVNFGMGAHLAELLSRMKGVDARIELGIAGAGVEWAMALGSSWIPRSFGEGYDETLNSHLVASFISRTRGEQVDPVTSRLHALTEGLLAVSGVPPLEVARNFNGTAVTQFRKIARRLMHQAPTQEEMIECIEKINQETRHFERRIENLKNWRLDTLPGIAIGGAVDSTIGPFLGFGGSIVASWLLSLIEDRIPSRISSSFVEIKETMLGLALAPSQDAVVVSRSSRKLHHAGSSQ